MKVGGGYWGKTQSQPEREKRRYWDQHYNMLCPNTKWWENNIISKIVGSILTDKSHFKGSII